MAISGIMKSMQEDSRTIVGVDLGTVSTRVVAGHINKDGEISVIGVGKVPTGGMRKGAVDKLNPLAKSIDDALGEAERMAGFEINSATININGSSILSTKINGMIAVSDGEVGDTDIIRLEDVSTLGKVPPNREILVVVPHEYILDGQSGIKDPIGMMGSRLEIKASAISVLTPAMQNLQKVTDLARVQPSDIVISPMAAAKAVLDDKQMDNGVALIDLGGATTGIAIYEDGDIQFSSVLPYGGNNITNDLAIGLRTTPEVAEQVKLVHADAKFEDLEKQVSIKFAKKNYEFGLRDINSIVDARLNEIFELISAKLKESGYYGKLPNGLVLVGGGANLKNIDSYAKEFLGLSVEIGMPAKNLKGLTEKVDTPEFATAVGLMIQDNLAYEKNLGLHSKKPSKGMFDKITKFFKK